MSGEMVVVWWLSEADYDVLEALAKSSGFVSIRDWLATLHDVPDYVRGQVLSRMGRNGRGRLWVSDELGLVDSFEIPWPDTPLTELLEKRSGGIVLRAADVPRIAGLPGLVTGVTLSLYRLRGQS